MCRSEFEMIKKILLNNTELQIDKSNLPCLIHGEAHVGSSLFTVSLIAKLYSQGEKILFLSGYPMARQEFIDQIERIDDVILAEKNISNEKLTNARVIFVARENANLFIKLASNLSDIEERVVLIKNIDLFNKETYYPVKDLEKIVLSGDLNECSYKELILEKKFKSTFLFSKTLLINFDLPNLNKFEGSFIDSGNIRGVVKLA